jgi:hypothetical protein
LEIALRIVQQEEALCLELANKDGLQASYGNQALILTAGGRLEEANTNAGGRNGWFCFTGLFKPGGRNG